MSKFTSAFYQDLETNIQTHELLSTLEREGLRIDLVDSLINELDEIRTEDGLTKTELARSLQQEPANVRRFFTAKGANPTMASFLDIALTLGYKIKLEPLRKADLEKLK